MCVCVCVCVCVCLDVVVYTQFATIDFDDKRLILSHFFSPLIFFFVLLFFDLSSAVAHLWQKKNFFVLKKNVK